MRYMTPDTPGTLSLESPAKRERMAKGAEEMPAVEVLSKMEATTPSATPTPTPSPIKIPSTASIAARKPPRRAIRTYGKKRTVPDETSEPQPSKRQKTTTVVPTAMASATTAPTPVRRDSIADEVSRQLHKEAAEAESRNNRRPQTPVKASPKTSPRKATPPRKAVSPRRVGIMRYFQPAARSAPPPPSLPEPVCSPTASISSMSSLSSCPSPASSIGSFRSTASSVVSSPSAKSSYSVDDTAFAVDVAGSPPSSPLWRALEQRPRQKRRLTIRPDRQMVATTTEDAARTKGYEQKEQAQEVDEVTKENLPVATSMGSSMMAASSSRMRLRLGLSNTTATSTTTKKRKKTAGPPSVQTTLSLAIAVRSGGSSDSASVRECKECNILYNPLHEKDAKFHARYHASVCRKQQRSQDREQSLSSSAAAAAGVRLR